MEGADDESEPLLEHARRVQATSSRVLTLSFLARIAWPIGLGCAHAALMRVESALTFPYLRTLQHCSGWAALPRDAEEWSGSDHCANRALVTREAQAWAGYIPCAGLVANTLCLPMLGFIGDRFGRRPLVVLYFLGLAAAAGINASFESIAAFTAATVVHQTTNGLTPALLAMVADQVPVEMRVPAYLGVFLAATPVSLVAYLGVTRFVLARHLHTYIGVWCALGGVATFIAAIALCCPETLEHRKRSSDVDVEKGQPGYAAKHVRRLCLPARAIACCLGRGRSPADARQSAEGAPERRELLPAPTPFAPCSSEALRFVMLVEAPAVFAFTAFSTLEGFTLTAFSWEQESIYYVRMEFLPAFVGAVLGSTWLVSRIGALRTLQIGILCLAAALGTMCFAQWHAWLLYGALLLASGAGLTVLPVLRVLITQVGPTHT